MASKRMFSLYVIDSDAFLDMPLTTQALYFHLCMRADDDGFINNPKKIQRMIRATDDDMRMLIAKQFLIPFDTGVLVIRHWKIHNVIRKDTYKPTLCTAEMEQIDTTDTGMYQMRNEPVTSAYRDRDDVVTDTSRSLPVDKNRLDKTRLDKEYEQIFSEIWSIYPNKKGRQQAFDAFRRSMKKGASADEIRSGVEAYARYVKVMNIEKQYQKYGSTFFKQEAWRDDWTPERPKGQNAFNQFEQNQYDFDELEKDLGVT